MLNDRADANVTTNNYKYDVFLSFRGPDTRSTFTGNLYHALRQKPIKTFYIDDIDHKPPKSPEEISPSVLKAIQESRISIVVLSECYGSSRRCMDELVTILDCMKNNNQNMVWPIFYRVYPSDIRHQTGFFGMLIDKYLDSSDDQRMRQWKDALSQVASLAGWCYKIE
ncbi:TMV resistance protein N-like [Trifolium medium]|uniref:TMV resistance protein N-like n=1 Tax=Trifolium medium TaxID=97028 RepID=A0A392MT18_9FABA|nr:TMV resistance protein N-like [Trifolium medium]